MAKDNTKRKGKGKTDKPETKPVKCITLQVACPYHGTKLQAILKDGSFRVGCPVEGCSLQHDKTFATAEDVAAKFEVESF